MEQETIIIILVNIVSFMGGIFTGFGVFLKFNKNLKLNKINNDNVITTHFPINHYLSPQYGPTAPPLSPIPSMSLEGSILEEDNKKTEIIIKN